MTCWINTVCLDHTEIGVRDGIVQADHGRPQRLAQLERGDGIVIYSPRTTMRTGDPVQAFTALGRIADDECFQVRLREEFHPWRRRVDWQDVGHAPIRPLLERLSFITDPSHWGMVFRRGLFAVPDEDFRLIAEAMHPA